MNLSLIACSPFSVVEVQHAFAVIGVSSQMVGVEYILLHAQEPILYIIRKQQRHAPSQGRNRDRYPHHHKVGLRDRHPHLHKVGTETGRYPHNTR